MAPTQYETSWFGPPEAASHPVGAGFARLWRGFMGVRIMTGVVLLLVQITLFALGQPVQPWVLALASGYLLATIGVRLKVHPSLPVRALDRHWLVTVGVDLVFFINLQAQQIGGINYGPLLALPVLLASVLGTMLLALGTAALVAILLLADAWWLSIMSTTDMTGRFLQAALTSTGLFIVAFLANQLASRLAGEELRSVQSQRAARIQTQVNELVIDNLTDGVLVVDRQSVARAANPAARALLGAPGASVPLPFSLRREPAWQSLADVAMLTFETRLPQVSDVGIDVAGAALVRVHVRTRLTAALGGDSESLCVIFLQDLREMEARVRTEKLAAMGRMSAAVAHEIRNPLAAIAQANALLEEDISDPAQRRLTQMVQQNAQRLSRIVEEVLDIARVQQVGMRAEAPSLLLDASAFPALEDWLQQTGHAARVQHRLRAGHLAVVFEAEHLRRLMVNLLDNASRYASQEPDAIIVSTRIAPDGRGLLQVWSDGAPLEQAVERHLFEPFFSSESRSSGLGLYICRELCERHGAVIGYERTQRSRNGDAVQGNAFTVAFRAAD